MSFTDGWSGVRLHNALERAAAERGETVAYVFPQGTLTFAEVVRGATTVSHAVKEAGIQPGDRVAVVMSGRWAWPPVFYGISAAGASVVAVNTRLVSDEVLAQLQQAGVKAVISYAAETAAETRIAERLDGALRQLPAADEEVTLDAAGGHRALDGTTLRRIEPTHAGRQDPADEALVLYTSGSTGSPKAASLNHASTLRGAWYIGEALALGHTDRFFSPQPFFHSGGAVLVMNAPVTTGCSVVVQDFFEPGNALELIQAHGCTFALGHQPHWVDLLSQPDAREKAATLRAALVIGDTPIRERVEAELGVTTFSPYGLTETHLGGACPRLDDDQQTRLTTHGRSFPGVQVRIDDPGTGEPAGAGEAGEILLGGWAPFNEYIGDREATSRALTEDSYVRTGDWGRVDRQGNLHRLGRLKDIIRVGGENVTTSEIEAVIAGHPAVRQVRVVATADDRLGEVPVAVVATGEASNELETELSELCGEKLASFKRPRHVILVDRLPMGATGKVDNHALKQLVDEVIQRKARQSGRVAAH